MKSRRKLAAKVMISRLAALELLKTRIPIQGEAETARRKAGTASASVRRRLVLATAAAFAGSWVPRLAEMNLVAAAGRASWVRVVKIDMAAARRETIPIWDRLRIRKRSM